MKPVPLSPLGTARERFLASRGRSVEPAPGLPVLPARIVESARSRDGGAEALQLAWELARCAPSLDPEGQRSLALLALAALSAQADGSTRVSLAPAALKERLLALGARESEVEAASRLAAAASRGGPGAEVLGGPGDFRPLVRVGDHLYAQRMLRLEDRVVEVLRRRLVDAGAGAVGAGGPTATAALAAVLSRPPIFGGKRVTLTDEQQAAVLAAVGRPLAVISGGPGTGKTSIVVSILRVLLRLGVSVEAIALAAPTGKAANRMGVSIRKYLQGILEPSEEDEALKAARPEPRTLHRLLGYSPSADRFKHHENNPLAEQVVIVDEASMVDLFLVERLVRAVGRGARLVLLGDADQLPSVEAGAVFRELLPPSAPPPGDPRGRAAVRLTKSFRMDPDQPAGRAILTVARAINDGRLDQVRGDRPERIEPRADAGQVMFQHVEHLAGGAKDRDALLARWFERNVGAEPELQRLARQTYRRGPDGFAAEDRADLGRLFRHHESFRILCLNRGDAGGTGAQAVNETLHRLAGATGPDPIPGEPVLVRRNDYDRGLFNGDGGLALRVSDGGRARTMAVFPVDGGYQAFPLDAMRADLDLAWAMTVHRSQGSEFDRVLVILPEEDGPLLTRELLYTAATRARESVVFVGPGNLLDVAAARPIRRDSGIGERLAAPAEPGR